MRPIESMDAPAISVIGVGSGKAISVNPIFTSLLLSYSLQRFLVDFRHSEKSLKFSNVSA